MIKGNIIILATILELKEKVKLSKAIKLNKGEKKLLKNYLNSVRFVMMSPILSTIVLGSSIIKLQFENKKKISRRDREYLTIRFLD